MCNKHCMPPFIDISNVKALSVRVLDSHLSHVALYFSSRCCVHSRTTSCLCNYSLPYFTSELICISLRFSLSFRLLSLSLALFLQLIEPPAPQLPHRPASHSTLPWRMTVPRKSCISSSTETMTPSGSVCRLHQVAPLRSLEIQRFNVHLVIQPRYVAVPVAMSAAVCPTSFLRTSMSAPSASSNIRKLMESRQFYLVLWIRTSQWRIILSDSMA